MLQVLPNQGEEARKTINSRLPLSVGEVSRPALPLATEIRFGDARSCVVISSARVSQRRASDRSVCFPDATGVSSGPGRSPAQRVTSARSVRACKGSRSTGGALTRICLSVLIAVVRALTALSRATLSCRIISTAPSAVLGVAVACPASTARAAASASIVSGSRAGPELSKGCPGVISHRQAPVPRRRPQRLDVHPDEQREHG